VKIKLHPVIKLIIKILVSAGMLWFVFSKINFSEVLLTLGNAKPLPLFAALLFFILSKLISAYRLNSFFRCTGLLLKDGYNIKLYLLGMFYNLFLPGGIGGDAYKIIILNREYETKAKDLFWATLLDRVTGLIALFILTIILTYFLPIDDFLRYILWLAIPLTIIIAWIVIRKFFSSYKSIFLSSNLSSLGVQISQLICAWFILVSLGQESNIPLFLAIFLISSIVAIFPFTLGGAGAREFTFTLLSPVMAFSIAEQQLAIALGLGFYLITVLTSLSGIWYYFFPDRMKS